jgi:replication-associated recombination protein RarA
VEDDANNIKKAMIIHGPAGVGKSIIASFIYETFVQKTKQQPGNQNIMLYFSFSKIDASRQSINSLARTLLSQLLEQNRDGLLFPLFDKLMENGSPTTSEMLAALGQAITLLS